MVDPRPSRSLGRYVLFEELAAGGMATVHFGRLMGAAGFTRTVAIKKLHEAFAKDQEFSDMFVDEARIVARVRHPNVVQTLDVVSDDRELVLVMDYVHGEPLGRLLKAAHASGTPIDPRVVAAILVGALDGLHAAHEAVSEHGQSLHIVHRDVSPQNILVGADGVVRIADFGIAKAALRVQVTRAGSVKGKLAYMAPEQLEGAGVDRRADIFSAGVVLWEMLTLRRLFDVDDLSIGKRLKATRIAPPSEVARVTSALDSITLTALARDPERRFASARDMAIAIEKAVQVASPREVAEFVEKTAGAVLAARHALVLEIERASAPGSEPTGARTRAREERAPTTPHVRPVASDDGAAQSGVTGVIAPGVTLDSGVPEDEPPTLARLSSSPDLAGPEEQTRRPGDGATPPPARVSVPSTSPWVTWRSVTAHERAQRPAAPGSDAALLGLAANVRATLGSLRRSPERVAFRVTMGATALLCLVALGVGLGSLRGASQSAAPAAAPPLPSAAGSAPAVIATGAPLAAPASSAAAAAAAASALAAASPLPSASEERPPPHAPSASAPRPPLAPPVAPRAARPACDPPWILDERGIRVIKKECR